MEFGSSSIHSWRGIPSRPASRRSSSKARSDTTERPDSSAVISPSLSHDIDHIKSLIGRSQETPSLPPAGTISAQIFRKATPTISTVTQGHIYHELDQLKRRIREELEQQQQHPLVRRISQIDPGQESEESDIEDVVDEREEELEKAREDVILVRERLDGLLERAESRVDGLTSDKEKLESKLVWYQNELDRSETQRRSLKQDLDKIRTDIRHLNTVLQGADKSFKEQNDLLAGLRKEKAETESARDEARREIANLSSARRELESALATSKYEEKQTAGRLRSLEEDQKSTAATLRSKISELQKAYRDKNNEAAHLQSVNLELEQKLEKAELRVSDVRKDYESRLSDLSAEADTSKNASEQALQNLEFLKNEHNQAVKTREVDKARIDELKNSVDRCQSELEAAASARQRLEKQVQDDKAMHDRAILALRNGHDADRKGLEETITELRSSHSLELKNARNNAARELLMRHADEVARLKAESDSNLDQAKTEHASALVSAKKLHKAELEAQTSKLEAELQALSDKLEQARRDYEDVSATHATELESVRVEASKNAQIARESLDDAERKLDESNKTSASRVEALENAVAREKHEKTSLSETLKDVEESSQERIKCLEVQLREFEEHVTGLENEIADMEKSGHAQLDKLTSQLASRAEDFSAASAELTSLREKTSRQIAEMEAAHKALSLEARKRQQQLEEDLENRISQLTLERTTAVQEALKAAEEKYRESLERAEAEAEGRIQKLKESQSQNEQQKRIDHESSLRATRREADETHGKALELLRNDFTKQKTDLQSEYENERARLESIVQSLREQHRETIDDMRRAHEAQIVDITARGSAESKERIDDLRATHETRIGDLEERREKALADMSENHALAMKGAEDRGRSLEAAHKEALEDMQRHSDEQFLRLKEDHASQIAKLEDRQQQHVEAMQKAQEALRAANDRCDALETSHATSLAEIESRHEVVLTRLRDSHQSELSAALDNAQQASAEAAAEHEDHVASQRSVHEAEISALREDLEAVRAELQGVQKRAEEGLSQANSEHILLSTNLETEWARKLEELVASHRVELEAAMVEATHSLASTKKEHQAQLAERESAADSRISELKYAHERELAGIRDDLAKERDAKLAAMEAEHLQNVEQMVRTHEETVDSAVEKARQSNQAEVQSLKQRHQDAITHVRSTAQKQYVAQLNELEKVHRQEMEEAQRQIAALSTSRHAEAEERAKSAAQSHQEEVSRLQLEHHKNIADLERHARAEHEKAIAAKQNDHESELQAVKARLDASLTGQAEAERSLAALRRRDSYSDKGSQERRASDTQVRALEAENHNLKRKLSLLQINLRPSSRRTSRSPTESLRDGASDMAALQLRVANLEEERQAMRRALSKKSEEKLDLIRQNDFLAKELDASLAKYSTSRQSGVILDALPQSEEAPPEPKADFSVLQDIKGRARVNMAPGMPSETHLGQDKNVADLRDNAHSFEAYMDNARNGLAGQHSVDGRRTELSQHRENDHELPEAKAALAAAYNTRVESLALDKEKMEEMVTQKQQTAFAKERAQLIASFGAHVHETDDQHPMKGLASAQAIALRAAEQRLVADFSNRLARRKSQIALRHAYEFQNLTADYDRKVAELLGDRSQLEGDLSVDPTKFERDLNAFSRVPSRLASERGRAVRRPVSLQVYASSPSSGNLSLKDGRPRTPMSPLEDTASTSSVRASSAHALDSVPRAKRGRIVLVSDEEEGRLASQPVQKTPERHAPVAQHSLMRAKSPSGVQSPPRRNVSNPSPFIPTMASTPSRNFASISMSGRLGKSNAARDAGNVPSPSQRLTAYAETDEDKQKAPAPAPTPATARAPVKSGFLRRVREKFSSDHTNSKRSSPSPSRPATSAGLPMTPRDPRPPSAASWRPKTAKMSGNT